MGSSPALQDPFLLPSSSPSQLFGVTGLILLVSHQQNMHVQRGAEQVRSVIPHSFVLQEVLRLAKLQPFCSSFSQVYTPGCPSTQALQGCCGIRRRESLWLAWGPSMRFLFHFSCLSRLTPWYQQVNHVLEKHPGPSILVSWWSKENIITRPKK